MTSPPEKLDDTLARTRRPPMSGFFADFAASIYSGIISRRNRRFDKRKGVITFDRPVISVGNLSTGGTGKTPLVLHLARVLENAGHKPAVAMRGYNPQGKDGPDSDEAAVYKRAMRSLHIVAQPNRINGLIKLFSTPHGSEVDVVLLDDGFQHRQIARQFDIIAIDATRDPFVDRLLPAGFLREPIESLKRANAFVLTHAEAVPREQALDLENRLWDVPPHAYVSVCRHVWSGILVVAEDGEHEWDVDWLRGRQVYIACAIGNPDPFIKQARWRVGHTEGGHILGATLLKDHADFTPDVVQRLVQEIKAHKADVLLVTEKDWSKLQHLPPNTFPVPIARPQLALSFDRGGAELEAAVLKTVNDFNPDAD